MWKKYDKVIEMLCVSLLGLIFVINVAQVVKRYILGSSFIWVEEISRVAQIWMVCLAISITWCMTRHIVLESIVKLLPDKIQYYLVVFNSFLSTIFTLVMTIEGYIITNGASVSWAASGVPVKLIYLSIPVGFALFTIRQALMTITYIKEHKSTVFNNIDSSIIEK